MAAKKTEQKKFLVTSPSSHIYVFGRVSDNERVVAVDRFSVEFLEDGPSKPLWTKNYSSRNPDRFDGTVAELVAINTLAMAYDKLAPFVAAYLLTQGKRVRQKARDIVEKLKPIRLSGRKDEVYVLFQGENVQIKQQLRNPHYITDKNDFDRVPSRLELSVVDGFQNIVLPERVAGAISSRFHQHCKQLQEFYNDALERIKPYTPPVGVDTPSPKSDIEELSDITRLDVEKMLKE